MLMVNLATARTKTVIDPFLLNGTSKDRVECGVDEKNNMLY